MTIRRQNNKDDIGIRVADKSRFLKETQNDDLKIEVNPSTTARAVSASRSGRLSPVFSCTVKSLIQAYSITTTTGTCQCELKKRSAK